MYLSVMAEHLAYLLNTSRGEKRLLGVSLSQVSLPFSKIFNREERLVLLFLFMGKA